MKRRVMALCTVFLHYQPVRFQVCSVNNFRPYAPWQENADKRTHQRLYREHEKSTIIYLIKYLENNEQMYRQKACKYIQIKKKYS